MKVEEKNIDEIMAKYDRESNVRYFSGIPKMIISSLFIAFTLYIFASTLFFTPVEQVRRTVFIGFFIFMGFLIYPISKKEVKIENHIPWYDFVFAVLGCAPYVYYAINCTAIINRAASKTTLDYIAAVVGIIFLIEICRRAVGFPIIVVAAGFIVYAFSTGQSWQRILRELFYNETGILGTPIGVCTTFIVLFIILGAFLEKTGIGTYFVDLANSVAGKAVGGPAKVAVISSALEGMYSGSSVANTVGSGSITIPVMKKTGYKPEFAAAVEASASTGGQIMPPIMGAAAFLMSEITGIPYATIAVTAILPAILYFTGIFMMIHFEAKKNGLRGLPPESIPNFFKLILHRGYLLLPIVVLVVMMNFRTAAMSACYAILCAIIVSFFSKDTRLTPRKFAAALENGAKNTIGVAIACAMAGIIIGVVSMTGLGQTLISLLVPLAQSSKFLALFLTMVSCIILGMGVPTTANYVIMATITAPILIKMGLPILAAHMFVFYFGIVADITPPVALAAYAGSAIANSNPFKTGVTATRLAITAFIVPYIFAYSPSMLFIDTTWYEVALIIVTSIVGIVSVAAGMEGFIYRKMAVWERLLMLGGGLLMIIPGIITDLFGATIIVVLFVLNKKLAKAPVLLIGREKAK